MKKWFIRIALVLVVLVVAGFFFAKSFITRDYLVAAIEKSINSRIQVKDIDVNIYGYSGSVNLNDVIITQRDDVANERVPHDEREKLSKGDIHLKSATFNISIWEIFSKKILVEKIKLDGVKLNVTMYENGDTSIEKLFAKPGDAEVKKPKKFNAKENEDFVTTINEIRLSDVTLNLIVEKTQLSVKGEGIYVDLLEINVNPKRLETINNAKIEIGGTFDIRSLETGLEYGKVISSGDSDFTLFNTTSGDLEPEMVISLTVDSESYLTNKVPSLSKIGKVTDMLSRFKIKGLRLPEKAQFKNDQSIRVGYKLGVNTLLDPLTIKIEDWEIEAQAQSWLSSGNDLHKLGVTIHVGEAISKKVGSFLNGKAGSIIGKLAGGSGLGLGSLLEGGKFVLHVESSGELSNPKIRVKNKIPFPGKNLMDKVLGGDKKENDKEDGLKKMGKDLLKGFFK